MIEPNRDEYRLGLTATRGKRLFIQRIVGGFIAVSIVATVACSLDGGVSIETTDAGSSLPKVVENELGTVREMMERIPDDLDGAARIDRFYVEDSRYLLIHVRDVHLYDTFPDPDSIKDVHENIYRIYFNLILKLGHRKIYLEGLTRRRVNLLNSIDRTMAVVRGEDTFTYRPYLCKTNLDACISFIDFSAIRLRAFSAKAETLDVGEREQLYSLMEEIKDDREHAIRLVESIKTNPAAYRVVSEGIIHFFPAEDDSLYALAEEIFVRRMAGEKIDIDTSLFYDDREDAFIEIIGSHDESLCIIAFGAAHAWGGKKSCGDSFSLGDRYSERDNIDTWNSANPDRKISLIEITPYRIEEAYTM